MFRLRRFFITVILAINLLVGFWYTFHKQDVWRKGSIRETSNDDEIAPTSQEGDSHRLVDLRNFEYQLQQDTCSRHIHSVIIVNSAPGNFEKRKLIRETWADRRLLRGTPLRVVFLFGSVENKTLQQLLMAENEKYADIVQGNFVDAYRNMTYKHVMAFKWFLQKCTHAQQLIKVDDDIFVNTPQLLRYVCDQSREPSPGTAASVPAKIITALLNRPHSLLCHRKLHGVAERNKRIKWHVSFHEYRKPYYPPYCKGFAIVYSKDVVARLYAAAQRHRFFWIDDVLITGILTKLNGIKIQDITSYILFQEKVNFAEFEFLFSADNIKVEKIRAIWTHFDLNEGKLKALQAQMSLCLENANRKTETHIRKENSTR